MREIFVYDHLLNPEKIFIAFDLETTGLSPNLDRIVEIGGVKFQDGRVVESFHALIDPEVPMPPDATKVNGITSAMLKGKPKAAEVIPQFLRFAGDGILIAHNAQFDTTFVNRTMSRLGLGYLKNDVIDTKTMAQKAFPGKKSYALQNLALDLGIVAVEAHRAEDDARVCMELFHACLAKLNPGRQASFF